MIPLILHIFIISFLINLLYEIIHSQLYKTCLKMDLKKYIPLIIGASVKDGLWITFFYFITSIIFNTEQILNNPYQLFLFVILSLSFSFIDEKISLKMKRWKY